MKGGMEERRIRKGKPGGGKRKEEGRRGHGGGEERRRGGHGGGEEKEGRRVGRRREGWIFKKNTRVKEHRKVEKGA